MTLPIKTLIFKMTAKKQIITVLNKDIKNSNYSNKMKKEMSFQTKRIDTWLKGYTKRYGLPPRLPSKTYPQLFNS